MTLSDEVRAYAKKALAEAWTRRKVTSVPEPDDLPLNNVAATLEGTVLYADLADSTDLVHRYNDSFAAEIYKNYLYSAAKIIRARGGTITAYDGDRVMGVFIGSGKNTQAAKCGLQINWVVSEILQPAIQAQYSNSKYKLEQKVGIDTSDLFVARTGIRGSNDLVWVGDSANNAAKMAGLSLGYPTYISASTYGSLNDSAKYGSDKRDMWQYLGFQAGVRVYGSRYTWEVH